MALQENTTYKLRGKDVIYVKRTGLFYEAARMTQVVANLKDVKPGELTLVNQPVELPRRTVDDFH